MIDWIGLTEEMVFNPPKDMKGWRVYRIEYGGIHEDCRCEGRVWLPPHADSDAVEALLRGLMAVETDRVWAEEG